MKRFSTILIMVLNVLLLSCNGDEIQPNGKISFDNVEILCDVLPPGHYSKIKFTSKNTAYTITNDGSVFKTEDGGSTWVQQNSGTEMPLYDIFFLDDLHGYIVGGNGEGVLLKTINGGNTWLSTYFKAGLSSIYFLNETIGFAAGGSLLKTLDGGESWEEVNMGLLNYGKINFFNKDTGLLTAMLPETLERVVLKTTDGGINWSRLNNVSLGLYTINKFQILNGTAYLITLGKKVFKTKDMGKTWQIIETPGQNSAVFINELQFIGVGQWWYNLGYLPDGILYLTNDGGKRWQEKHTKGADEFFSIEDIDFSSDSTVLAVGQTNMGCIIKIEL